MNGFIDGDFPTDKQCKYHCSPTCHPGQIGPDWKYGCTHKAWPQNKYGDFVPLVECNGEYSKCELKHYKKLIGRYKGGLTRSMNYLQKKLSEKRKLLNEISDHFK